MKALDLSIILKLVDKVTAPLKGVVGGFGKVKGSADAAIASVSRFERVSAAVQRTTDRLRGMAAMAAKAGAAMAAIGGVGGGAVAANAVSVTADFEQMDTVLDTLYRGDKAQIGKAKGFLKDFMAESPFETASITEGFNRLKAYGIDPMDGSLKTMGDTAAAMGKDIMSAVEMMADAVMGENERLKEFGIKGNAIQGTDYIQYEYTDKNGIQQKLQVLKNDRKQIQRVLTQILNENYGGSSAKLAKTFKGLTSNTKDALNNLQMQFMNAGIFDFLKNGLQNKLDMLNALSKSGKVEDWGKKAAHYLKAASDYASKLSDTVMDAAKQIAAFAGGWKNLGMIGAGAGGLWLFKDLIFAVTAGVGALPLLLAGITASLVDWDKLLPRIKQMFSKLLPEGGLDFSIKGGLKLPPGGLLQIKDAALDAVQARLTALKTRLAPLIELFGTATDKAMAFGKQAMKALSGVKLKQLLPAVQFGFSLTPFHLLTRAGKVLMDVFLDVFASIRDRLPQLRQQFGDVFGVIGRWLSSNAGTVRATLSGVMLLALEKLSQGLAFLSAKARDGSLRSWLDVAASKIRPVLDNVLAFGRGVWATVLKIGKFTAKFAEFIGGWDKLAMVLAGGWVIAALSGFLQGLGALLGIIALLASPVGLLVALIVALAVGARMVYLEWGNMSTGSKVLAVAIAAVGTGILAYIGYLKLAAMWTAFQLTPIGVWIAGLSLASVWAGISAAATWVMTAATSAFGVAMAIVTSPITLVIAAIAALAAGAYLLYTNWDTIKPMLLAFWEDIKAVWGTFVTWVSGMADSIVAFFAALPAKMLEVGGNIINGLWDGLKNSATAVVDWMAGFGSDIIDSAKGILGINSPSRVFAEIGGFTVEGMQQGMETAQPKLFSFLDGFGDKLTGWWKGVADAFTGDDIAANIGKAFEATKNALPSLPTPVSNALAAILPGGGVVSALGQAIKAVQQPNKSGGKFDAVQSALAFSASGRLTGMDEAQTRAYAANAMKTESGGKVDSVNSYGFSGQYQFGADALAEGGFVHMDKLRAAKAAAGKAWYEGGHHKAFLQNAGNWKLDGGQQAFLSNKALQDNAFVEYTNRNIKSGFRSGALKGGDDPAKIAAYAKAAHLKGAGGANKLFLHGADSRDAYGTSTAGYAQQARDAIKNLAPVVQQQLAGKVTPITNQMPPAIQDLQARAANDPLFAQALNKQSDGNAGSGDSSTVVPFARPAPQQSAVAPQQTISITINAAPGATAQDIAAEVQRVLREETRRAEAKYRGRAYD